MSASGVAAPTELPEAPGVRLGRASLRVARLGLVTLSTARQLERVRGSDGREAARERARVLREVSQRALELHGLEIDAAGALPLGPALLASNHVSWLDPLVVASLLPCVPVSKLDLAGWPIVGGLARELGVVFVSRGDPRSGVRVLRSAEDALRNGLPVLNFPEGTTTTRAEVRPFRKGLFGIAQALRVPVVPVAIAYDPPELAWVGDDAFLPHWLGLAASRRSRAFVRIGAPIPSHAHDDAAQLASGARDEVVRLLSERR